MMQTVGSLVSEFLILAAPLALGFVALVGIVAVVSMGGGRHAG